MVVLIDANVVINYITQRNDTYKDESVKIMKKISEGVVEGYIAFHTVSIIDYILRKYDATKRKDILNDVCSIMTVSGASHNDVVKAINNDDFNDFEDCLQYVCAETVNADYIVTCNLKDFEKPAIKAIYPD